MRRCPQKTVTSVRAGGAVSRQSVAGTGASLYCSRLLISCSSSGPFAFLGTLWPLIATRTSPRTMPPIEPSLMTMRLLGALSLPRRTLRPMDPAGRVIRYDAAKALLATGSKLSSTGATAGSRRMRHGGPRRERPKDGDDPAGGAAWLAWNRGSLPEVVNKFF